MQEQEEKKDTQGCYIPCGIEIIEGEVIEMPEKRKRKKKQK